MLLLKPWKSICNRWYRTQNLTGGAPFSNMCLYLQSEEDISLWFINIAVYTLKIETFLCKNMSETLIILIVRFCNKNLPCSDIYTK